VVSFFKNFQFTDQQIGTLMDRMNQSASEETAARNWIDNHQELVDGWIGAQPK
jgi:glycine betaine/proline transport system substrate-binding protein